MSITTYSELLTAVQNWLARDDADIQARIPEFIALTEARITWGSEDPQFPSPALRARQMETRLETTVDGEYEDLPADYISMVKYKLKTDPPTELRYVTDTQLDKIRASSTTAKPLAFTVVGSEIRFAPAPDTAYTGEIVYYAAIPALTVSNTTNWLLTAAPNVYLYGVLLEASLYIGEDERIRPDYFLRGFCGALKGLQMSSRDSRVGGALSPSVGVSVV